MQQCSHRQEKSHLIRLKQGSSVSFEWLYHRYQPKLYAFCYHLTRAKPDAEEVVQQVFVKVWETRHRIDPERSFSAYLIHIGRHIIYNKTAQRVRDFAFQEYFSATTTQQSNVTQEQINLRSLENTLHSLVQKLPFMQRKVFLLSRNDGLSNQEIANRLQLSKSTVENHIFSALKTLKKQLSKHYSYLPFTIFYRLLAQFIDA
ncbi:MAG: RNA polymerase sigma-70 factor [Bacteroidota bacterium]